MGRVIHALLVGIDAYPPPVSPLGGCVHDVALAADVLQTRAAAEGAELRLVMLTDAQATRGAVVDAFRAHLCRARPADAAVFYFSGHGSQQPCAPELGYLEPDGLDETLVCFDSRQPGRYDLADKELGALLAEVAEHGAHVLTVLDCCHSGSGTRAGARRDGAVRRAPTDARPRPADSYLVAPGAAPNAQPNVPPTVSSNAPPRPGPDPEALVPAPSANAVVLAACRADQQACEAEFDGRRRGVFSYFLLDALARARGPLSYGALYRRVKALVAQHAADQAPGIEWGDAGLLRRPFLGGAAAADEPHFVLRHDVALGWAVDGGALHGVAGPSDGETTTLAIHPFDTDPRSPRPDVPLATARVEAVLPHASRVRVDAGPNTLDVHETYVAAVTGVPLPRVGVRIEGAEHGVAALRAALANAGVGGRPSPHVRAVDDSTDAELHVVARDGRYVITRPAGDCPDVGSVAEYGAESARTAVHHLEHVARWITVARLANPAGGIARDAVGLAVYRVTGPSPVRSLTDVPIERCAPAEVLEFDQDDRTRYAPRPAIKLRLRNAADEPLYGALLLLSEEYEIDVRTLLPGGRVRLAPGEEVWARQGRPLAVAVPDALWARGVARRTQRLKLLVSNRDFEPLLLEQAALPQPRQPAPVPASERDTIDRLTGGGATRDATRAHAAPARWTTADLTVTTVRRDGGAVPTVE